MEAGDVVKSHINAGYASVIYIQLPQKARVHVNKGPSFHGIYTAKEAG